MSITQVHGLCQLLPPCFRSRLSRERFPVYIWLGSSNSALWHTFTKSVCALTGALLSINLPIFAAVCSQLNVEHRNIWWSKMYGSHDEEFLLSLVSWKSSWKLRHNPKLSKPELSRNVAVSWERMLWNKERNNCMSHGCEKENRFSGKALKLKITQ